MADRDGGFVFDAGKQTVGEYLARWLSNSVRGTVRQRTYERYESLVRVHLVPSIGRLKLKALTPDHVRELYREKLDGGLAPRTVLHLHRTISKALKQAHDDGLIPRNAAASVKAPQPRRQEIRPLSREQVRTLLEAAGEAGNRLEALYVVAVAAGLRRGELGAQVGRRGPRRRDAPGTPHAFGANSRLHLRGPQERQGPERTAHAEGHGGPQRTPQAPDSGTDAAGHALARTRPHIPLQRRYPPIGGQRHPAFKTLLSHAGLPTTTRFHDMRHTCATLLLRQGVNPKSVQELLGHADISLTLNVYSHVLPDMGDAAAGAMDAALG